MKKAILLAMGMIISASAFADTVSERTAGDMVTVLQSKEVASLLSQNDGVGNIKSIEYAYSARASFGPAVYELGFISYGGMSPQECKVEVQVHMQNHKVMGVGKATCKEIGK